MFASYSIINYKLIIINKPEKNNLEEMAKHNEIYSLKSHFKCYQEILSRHQEVISFTRIWYIMI